MAGAPRELEGWAHDAVLSCLARANGDRLKAFAEPLIAELPEISVEENRTGLVMLPMQDTAQGVNFHLGEVLVSEARISAGGQIGYGMRRGRDLKAAMAMALVDLAIALGAAPADCRAFLDAEAEAAGCEDRKVLCKVEATRVDMETF